jgi:predicted alpha/beta superfamily hydrolase
VLGGFSYGGLFAAYALFAEPGLFTGYLIGSPSLGWDDGAFYTLDAVRANRADPIGAQVFLSAGELEPATAQHTARLAYLLQARLSEDLDVQTHFIEGETHLSVIPATLSRGLRALFTVP